MTERRKGEVKNTVFGPRAQHHNVWISLRSQKVIAELARSWKIDENAVIGKIIDYYIDSQSSLEDHLSSYSDEITNQFLKNRVRRV